MLNPWDEIDVNVNVIASNRQHQMLISNSYQTECLLQVFPEEKLLSVLNIL